jgi:2-polyprenyl-3-methyl-5-hydroxy-6-metoxy-1,4-benzoquinol methylase
VFSSRCWGSIWQQHCSCMGKMRAARASLIRGATCSYPGTHEYAKFVRPEELESALASLGMKNLAISSYRRSAKQILKASVLLTLANGVTRCTVGIACSCPLLLIFGQWNTAGVVTKMKQGVYFDPLVHRWKPTPDLSANYFLAAVKL